MTYPYLGRMEFGPMFESIYIGRSPPVTSKSISKKNRMVSETRWEWPNRDVLVRRVSLVIVNGVVLMTHHFCEGRIVLKTLISLTAFSVALTQQGSKLTLAKPLPII